jgi:hypothetical protein
MSTRSAINVLRGQYSHTQDYLADTLDGVTEEVAHYDPPGLTNSIAAQLGHVVTSLDFFVLGFGAGQAPLITNDFANKSGLSELPPQPGTDWHKWGQTVKIDLAALAEYRQAVFAEIDNYLASLEDDDLHQERSFGPDNTITLGFVLNLGMQDVHRHIGEISCIKGLQGLKGYQR